MFHRWAEPLEDGIARVLAEEIGARLPTERIVMFPWRGVVAQALQYQVVIAVLRFDRSAGADVTLDTRWQILGRDGGELAFGRSTVVEATTDAGYEALVAAMSGDRRRDQGDAPLTLAGADSRASRGSSLSARECECFRRATRRSNSGADVSRISTTRASQWSTESRLTHLVEFRLRDVPSRRGKVPVMSRGDISGREVCRSSHKHSDPLSHIAHQREPERER